MAYKLKAYECYMCEKLKKCYADSTVLAEALDCYERNTVYLNFDESAIWALFRLVMRQDNYNLYDKMRAEIPDMNDTHIKTLMHNAIKTNYGHDVTQLLQLFRGKIDRKG